AKTLLAEARDGDVRRDAALRLEELRVHDAARRAVDQVARHALEQRQRARPAHLELAEGAHVDDAGRLAERRVLFADELEPGRPGPAERALVGPRAPPGMPIFEMLGALPA